MYKRILVPTDGSALSKKAVKSAVELASSLGAEVVALNVTKLRSDNFDPREYLERVDNWRERVEKSGGHWRMINDLERLDGLL